LKSSARNCLSAYTAGEMVATPPSARPGFDLNHGYAVSRPSRDSANLRATEAVGRKVGYANKAMCAKPQLETLVWAHMYDDHGAYSDGNSATYLWNIPVP